MKKLAQLSIAALAAVLAPASAAWAHCDSVDGPVAKAALTALDAGDAAPALVYAPASAEAEINAAFAQSLKVRALGGDAKVLADKAFIETVVRLHRAGEGAVYTGLKPAGLDHGPAIPAAEKAIASGDLGPVEALLADEISHGLSARFRHVGHTEPAATGNLEKARQHASAELEFVTYVETLRQAAKGAAGHAE